METKPIAIVTGANGFLAQNLAARLREEGWRVIGISREADADALGETLAWDAFWRPGGLDLASVNAVFHLAAYRPPDLEDSGFAEACFESNAMLTLRLAERFARESRARFIYCSAGNIYGQQEERAAESAPLRLSQRACFYLSSKFLGEVFLERTRLAMGLRATSFRVSSLYGPGMPQGNMIARFATLARQGQPLPVRNGGVERYDMVFVEDIVDLLIHAAASSAEGVFNAGSGESSSVKDIAAAVNEAFGNPAGCQLGEPGAIPPQAGFAPLCLELTSATFGYAPRSMRTGIAQYRKWLETQVS